MEHEREYPLCPYIIYFSLQLLLRNRFLFIIDFWYYASNIGHVFSLQSENLCPHNSLEDFRLFGRKKSKKIMPTREKISNRHYCDVYMVTRYT